MYPAELIKRGHDYMAKGEADSARVDKLERLLNRMNIEELMDLLTGDLHVRAAIDSVREEE